MIIVPWLQELVPDQGTAGRDSCIDTKPIKVWIHQAARFKQCAELSAGILSLLVIPQAIYCQNTPCSINGGDGGRNYRPEGKHGGCVDAAADAIRECFDGRVAIGVGGKVAVHVLILVVDDQHSDR